MRSIFWKRKHTGAAISELAASIGILVLLIFFPMVDLVNLLVAYGSCSYLNHLQVTEAALVPSIEAQSAGGVVKKGIPDMWRSMGMGKYLNISAAPDTTVSYRKGEKDSNGVQNKFVRVATKVTVQPMLSLPFPPNVPGLSKPVPFIISTEHPMENPNNAP